MKCAVHTEADAAGFCRHCGKALCAECTRDVRGILYCEACLAEMVAKPEPAPAGSGSPPLAAVLGIIPGLGAIYNGEYVKAVLHVLIFGSLIALADRSGGAFAPLLVAFIIYMPFEAYRTAQARLQGKPSPMPLSEGSGPHPAGAYVLIGLGGLLLLDNFGFPLLRHLGDYLWPLLLIAAGVWLLMRRRAQSSGAGSGPAAAGGGQ